MRLWHQLLIPNLPNKQLQGLHREVAAMRGLFWGRNHSTVNYVWHYSPLRLFRYHQLIMKEMERRGYNVSKEWKDPLYRGKRCKPWLVIELGEDKQEGIIYPEHDEDYLNECLNNLYGKGIDLREVV